jgi:hypothetical protein
VCLFPITSVDDTVRQFLDCSKSSHCIAAGTKARSHSRARFFGVGMDLSRPILVTGASGKTGCEGGASICQERWEPYAPSCGVRRRSGPLKQAGAAEIGLAI